VKQDGTDFPSLADENNHQFVRKHIETSMGEGIANVPCRQARLTQIEYSDRCSG
jgi:hypothetical protein